MLVDELDRASSVDRLLARLYEDVPRQPREHLSNAAISDSAAGSFER